MDSSRTVERSSTTRLAGLLSPTCGPVNLVDPDRFELHHWTLDSLALPSTSSSLDVEESSSDKEPPFAFDVHVDWAERDFGDAVGGWSASSITGAWTQAEFNSC